ncbi:HAD family hydrolase [Aquibacillus sediminis]|uniref:HAD family hydrolase n=1 Tax=Aquibacillus sediminis TaxID=2574734 RepID=UPI002482DE02|nr:HAD family hydrolase [Aquibacillus sediminis]
MEMDTIIFDVDDTLYDQALPFKITYKKLFDQPLTEAELNQLYTVSRKHSDVLFDKWEAGEIPVQELQIRRMTQACEEFGIAITEQKALEFQNAYVKEQRKIVLFDEVKQLLDDLYQQNKQLAVLTNGETDHQSMKIKQLNLTNWIPAEHLFISGAIGYAKPKQEVFNVLEDQLQLDTRKTIYIGDSFHHDIVGAKKAGWQAIWMNHRKRDMPESSYKPDLEVHSAKELYEALSRCNRL